MDKGLLIRRVRLNHVSSVSIEVTTYCNKACPMCCHNEAIKKPAHMEIGVFDKIVSDVKKNRNIRRDTVFSLCGLGEPLLYPNIVYIISEIKKHFNSIISINTNCILLPQATNMLLELLDEQDIVCLSVSASTQVAYEKLVGGDLEKVEQNIKYFLNQRLKTINPPGVFLRYIEHEDNSFSKFFSKWQHYLSNSVEIRRYPLLSWSESNEIDNHTPCINLWKAIVYDVGGRLLPCCRALDTRQKANTDVEWLKRQHLHKSFPGMCNKCGFKSKQQHHIKAFHRWW